MDAGLIIYIIGFAIFLLNLTWIYGKVVNKRLKINKGFILLFIFLVFASTYLNTLKFLVIKPFLSLIYLIILTLYTYKGATKSKVFYCILLWGFAVFIDTLFMILFSYINQNHIIPWPFTLPIEYFLTFPLQLIYNLIARLKFFKKCLNKLFAIFDKISVYFIFLIISFLVYSGILIYMNLQDFNKEITIFIVSIFSLSLIIQSLCLVYTKIVDKEAYKVLQNNNKFYVESNIDFRTFKHNLKHKLDGVKAYSNDKTKELLNIIVEDLNMIKQANVELEKIPNGLSGLIQSKIYNRYDNSVLSVVENNLNCDIFDLITPRDYIKLCDVIGVTMDNALESMKDCKEKIVYLTFDDGDEDLEIVIKNTFSSFVDVDKLGIMNYSTKGDNHGIGLFSILTRNTIKTKLSIINDMFETKIFVNKK